MEKICKTHKKETGGLTVNIKDKIVEKENRFINRVMELRTGGGIKLTFMEMGLEGKELEDNSTYMEYSMMEQ